MNDFTIEFSSEDTGCSVVIEVDDQFAYAYFVTPDGITGDVWLFNRAESPTEIPWKSGAKGPFLNPKEFAYDYKDAAYVQEDDFRVFRKPEDAGKKAAIYFKGRLIALIWDGGRPGKSAFAKQDSPVALAFEEPAARAPSEWIA